MTVPPRGPPCRACGCTEVEHEAHVAEDWTTVFGRCLTCDCEGFVLNDEHEAREAGVAPA